MKLPATTTQPEAPDGRAIHSQPFTTPSASRRASPDAQNQESGATYNPPTYTESSIATPPSEKEHPENPRDYHRHFGPGSPTDFNEGQSDTDGRTRTYAHEGSRITSEEPRCDILSDRPAACLYGAFTSPAADPGSSDPISGILTATHSTVVGVLGGVSDYPVAISRIATSDPANSKREAASFAMDGNKGVSRIVGTALKAPMEYTTGISQGFNNVPKLWGDNTVRRVEPVTGVKSGFKAAGKGFGLGLYDGITGLVTQPVKGAREGGVVGAVGGFFKGIGGVACKTAAGVAGLPANALKGFYEEYQKKRGMNTKSNNVAAQMQQGWEEFASSSMEERIEVIAKLYQFESVGGDGYKIQMM